MSLLPPSVSTQKESCKIIQGRDPLQKPFKRRKKKRDQPPKKPKIEEKKTAFDIKDVLEEKDTKEYEDKIEQQPFEEYVVSICNEKQWTAAFTITKILGKPTRTLANTGASHSVVSLN